MRRSVPGKGMRKETAGEAEVTKAEATVWEQTGGEEAEVEVTVWEQTGGEVTKAEASVEGMAGEHTGQNPAGQAKGRKAGVERDFGFWQ